MPAHGRVNCVVCHKGQEYSFDRTVTEEGNWRITNNPLAWGSQTPEIIVLGFSKGPTQAGGLAHERHENIAYKGGRLPLARILHHVGLMAAPEARLVDRVIADPNGRFHFASLIRCTVEQFNAGEWKGTGGDMLGKFLSNDFGRQVALNCGSQFLQNLPTSVRLVVMLGMGSKQNYISACRSVFQTVRGGNWENLNAVSYSDGRIVVVHTEHFKSQGALLPNWLSGHEHERGRYGLMARAAVQAALR